MHALDGCRAKVERAQTHFDAIQEVIRGVDGNSGPYVVDSKDNYDPKTRCLLSTVTAVPELPLAWGIILGDIVHNLRSALDHLIWQLALLDTAQPHRRTQFPIVLDREDWESVAKDRLRSVHTDHWALIKSCQPFIADEPTDHVLAYLNTLSNTDKHRLVQPVLFRGGTSEHTPLLVEDCMILSVSDTTTDGIVDVGTELVRIHIFPTGQKPRVQMQSQFQFYVALPDGHRIEHIVGLGYEYVAGLIEHAAPLFPLARSPGHPRLGPI